MIFLRENKPAAIFMKEIDKVLCFFDNKLETEEENIIKFLKEKGYRFVKENKPEAKKTPEDKPEAEDKQDKPEVKKKPGRPKK